MVVPLEYESAEAFICNFADWAANCIQESYTTHEYPIGQFVVGKKIFSIDDFIWSREKQKGSTKIEWVLDLPCVYTLEEWFDKE
jgi:hypothetical protein